MIDFHSHILPAMDDGSKNTEESLAMLNSLKQQGVKCVVATPHFYANDDSVDSFLERRQKSFDKVKTEFDGEYPQILLGAEVRYYEGLSKLERLSDLCIQESKLLLVEMPSGRWTEYVLNELLNLSSQGRFMQVVCLKMIIKHIQVFMK